MTSVYSFVITLCFFVIIWKANVVFGMTDESEVKSYPSYLTILNSNRATSINFVINTLKNLISVEKDPSRISTVLDEKTESKYPSSQFPWDLHPIAYELFLDFAFEMHAAGINYAITSTYRNDEDQNALYTSGREKPGPILTNAKAGESPHNKTLNGKPAACAFDIAIKKNGKLDWDTNNPDWKKAGELGVKIGLEWGGNWIDFKDYPHFELPNWKEL